MGTGVVVGSGVGGRGIKLTSCGVVSYVAA